MALVAMTEMLKEARKSKYAVGQFNLNTLRWAVPILQAAEVARAPIILAASDRLVDTLGGFSTIVATVKSLLTELAITVPVALHLDHSQSVDHCKQAIAAGFTSVMIDASHLPIAENIALTKEVVAYAKQRGVSVEAEVGIVGGVEDGLSGTVRYANPEECVALVKATQIDALAAALGSVHGPYHGEPQLGFEEMEKIANLVEVPLVLHGASGIPDKQIKKAIALGHAKINVNTECAQAFTATIRTLLSNEENATIYEPNMYLEQAYAAIKEVVAEKIALFMATNRV